MPITPLSTPALLGVARRLPAAPRLLVDLGLLLRNPFATIEEVVVVLRQDPSLVSRTIQMANSVAYARAEPAGSIEEAVAAIGFGEVHRVVGAVAAAQFGNLPLKLYGVTAGRLRENALFVAALMEELAVEAGEDSQSAYTVGLLRSIGKMAFEQSVYLQGGALSFADSGDPALDVWERSQWGMDNCEAAELILKHWRLPHESVTAVRHHYRPSGRHNPVIHLLALATDAARARGYGLPGEEAYCQPIEESFEKAGLDQERFDTACERAQLTFDRLREAVAA